MDAQVALMEEAKGDCFTTALALVYGGDDLCRRLGISTTRHLYLCHGIPYGQAGNAAGLRYWHAWIEIGDPAAPEGVVVDWSNGKIGDTPFKRTAYYRIGQIDPAMVLRYTRRDARRFAIRTDHAGPWEERPEHEALITGRLGYGQLTDC